MNTSTDELKECNFSKISCKKKVHVDHNGWKKRKGGREREPIKGDGKI